MAKKRLKNTKPLLMPAYLFMVLGIGLGWTAPNYLHEYLLMFGYIFEPQSHGAYLSGLVWNLSLAVGGSWFMLFAFTHEVSSDLAQVSTYKNGVKVSQKSTTYQSVNKSSREKIQSSAKDYGSRFIITPIVAQPFIIFMLSFLSFPLLGEMYGFRTAWDTSLLIMTCSVGAIFAFFGSLFFRKFFNVESVYYRKLLGPMLYFMFFYSHTALLSATIAWQF